jgi:hypothetical protein
VSLPEREGAGGDGEGGRDDLLAGDVDRQCQLGRGELTRGGGVVLVGRGELVKPPLGVIVKTTTSSLSYPVMVLVVPSRTMRCPDVAPVGRVSVPSN